ncbi:tRNA (adenosine(37)-N6)-dimethylallyltransferase MiaA [Mucilaginibacter ginkgonis]|uniref:tRNA dimethylallyltransferase n=1 Tax=Mucilaginibacter ginkgonis TaxID=2682091 RepID=A0A6I4HXD1_9SPHI|nr:tRNA (adenosine(37)-N6)-dimethylallyltransferase MiaA [Mucilaginibacter ginkgonis]QQL48265.1 tRNA (adenosine(37)-N6)-dimethylallyltransferase MiaA [Mucilaginibacter ginkgonis]
MAAATDKTLIVVAGPTAVGKTAAAIKLAQHFGTEIVSADSRQFYKEMSIGTAKPTIDELAAAPHHFIGSHSVEENFTVGDFEKAGVNAINEIFRFKNIAVLVGGSGLFVKAICEGFDELPSAPAEVREKLNIQLKEHGIDSLQLRLKEADPVYYAEVDINNPQRVIRALEVFDATGKPFSSFRSANVMSRPFRIVKIGLNMPREILYDRINQRVDAMIADGLVDEVKSLLPYRHLNALNTVGYTEIFDYLEGKINLPTAIELVKQHTRQFAKRQLTWFNNDKEIHWINPSEDDVLKVAKRLLETSNPGN